MAYDYSQSLNSEKALIFRIVHRDNLPWILTHGLWAGNATEQSDTWVHIGLAELISKRANHPVPLAPFGVLNDYVPFYFTPFSPMLSNIHSGRGVQQRSNDEILILVSSLHRIAELELAFLFTDSHAYYQWANFYDDLGELNRIDWPILQRRDFKRDPDDLAKFERYQAEALVHQHCPVEALLGVVCYNEVVKTQVEQTMTQLGITRPVYVRSGWYF
ncbi:type II toxin-antitoxin system toxin DNA ADP-ribosyl transferase DarT [Aeromonas rivipollensis]|uniref:type II toxin-antitoxin system toxin DNA ADP-ribosyl transferase DarT n=1 Tax=Aeromonas rivipollensis TaxID=948519 RepID=UPI003D1B3438